jgi:hypothetical protein
MMPYLSYLSELEMKSLIHMVQNRTNEEKLVQDLTSDDMVKRLAKLSETENHALKNRYRH